MTELFVQLVPELIGLVITPAAIVACLLLLDSSRPIANVALFATAFVLPYAVISVVVVAVGSSAGSEGEHVVKAWVDVVLGSLFLVGAALGVLARIRRRGRGPAEGPPRWVRVLEDPGARTLVAAALALSALNPNLAILLAGLVTVVTAEVTAGDRTVGVLLLLGACLLDFAVPVLAFVLLGTAARTRLHAAKDWLIRNNAIIGAIVLLAFGVLFLTRGLDVLV